MRKPLDWLTALVVAAVLILCIISAGNAAMGGPFDPLRFSGALFLLLIVPILQRWVARRRK